MAVSSRLLIPALHFGLGNAGPIDAIEITWPSGMVDRYRGLSPNTRYLVREGQKTPGSLPCSAKDSL